MRISMRPATDDASVRIVAADDEPVGLVRLAEDPDGALRIVTITVEPAWRGRGIGTAVIRALDEEAARAGVAMTTTVGSTERALGLFARLGFVAAGEDAGRVHLRRA